MSASAPSSRARPRAGRSPERRAQILDAAERAFAASGFHAASMDAIADAVGVGKPVLYRHFGSKEGLYGASLERAGQQLVERLAAVARQAGPREQLEAGVLALPGLRGGAPRGVARPAPRGQRGRRPRAAARRAAGAHGGDGRQAGRARADGRDRGARACDGRRRRGARHLLGAAPAAGPDRRRDAAHRAALARARAPPRAVVGGARRPARRRARPSPGARGGRRGARPPRARPRPG